MVTRVPGVSLAGLTKTYGSQGTAIRAVDGIDLELEPGGFTALVGPSGCGKTTLLRLIAGLERPSSGSIRTNPAGSVPAVVFQDPRLLPWMTVKKNLLLALRRDPEAPEDGEGRLERVAKALRLVGLDGRSGAYPHQLSGGMAQRAGLARALCRESGFLLMDEPFSALDAITRERLQRDLKAIWENRKSTVFFITHDIREAAFLSERILVMNDGRIAGDIDNGIESDVDATIGKVVEILQSDAGV